MQRMDAKLAIFAKRQEAGTEMIRCALQQTEDRIVERLGGMIGGIAARLDHRAMVRGLGPYPYTIPRRHRETPPFREQSSSDLDVEPLSRSISAASSLSFGKSFVLCIYRYDKCFFNTYGR